MSRKLTIVSRIVRQVPEGGGSESGARVKEFSPGVGLVRPGGIDQDGVYGANRDWGVHTGATTGRVLSGTEGE